MVSFLLRANISTPSKQNQNLNIKGNMQHSWIYMQQLRIIYFCRSFLTKGTSLLSLLCVWLIFRAIFHHQYGLIFSELLRIAHCTLRLTGFVPKACQLYTRMTEQGANKARTLRQRKKAFQRYHEQFPSFVRHMTN